MPDAGPFQMDTGLVTDSVVTECQQSGLSPTRVSTESMDRPSHGLPRTSKQPFFLGGNPMRLRLIFSCCLAAVTAAMTGCGATGGYNLPPASRLMEPGPGVGGPGPGVLSMPTPGIQAASYAPVMSGGPIGGGAAMTSTDVQVLFARPEAMQVSFDVNGAYDSTPIITPGRQNFTQGGVYRLKVTGVPGREGTELYPTLELGPGSRQTAAYLAHNAIPIQFTEEDFSTLR